MNFFKKATDKTAAKKDLGIVIDYIKSGLKSELNRARYFQKTGMNIDFDNDDIIKDATDITKNIIKDFDEIQKRTEHQRSLALNAQTDTPKTLSPDAEYTIKMGAIQDIKKTGLTRPLNMEEKRLIKTAARRFNELYSEQLKAKKHKTA